jgi:GAF domain-containing protein
MPAAAKPLNEVPRYAALLGYHLRKNVLGDIGADELVRTATRHFGVPQSAIALVGASTVYFVAEHGVGFHTIPRDISFCAYAIHSPKLLVVSDATKDLRFADNPLVLSHPCVRFYAGAPLIDRDGYCLGTFCLVDTTPRLFAADEAAELTRLSERAMQRVDFLSTVSEALSGSGAPLIT